VRSPTLHRTVLPDGSSLAWRRVGRVGGPPVLLLQGYGTPGSGWAVALAALARQFDCLVPDLRGTGRSGPVRPRLTGAALADDALRLLDDAGVERAHVVGNSLGGAVAQSLTVAAPDRVRSLSLLATTCGHTAWRDLLFTRLEELGRRGDKAAAVRTLAPWARRRGGSAVADAVVAAAAPLGRGLLRSTGEELGALAHVIPSQPPDLCARLAGTVAEHRLPALVLAGAWDRLAPREETQSLAALLGARYVQLPTGHLLSATPSAARVLRRFLLHAEDGTGGV
jgi:pimeloyl-ACP methyl ester carboxylesterase